MLAVSLTSCAKPPEYAEIEARFRELVEASYEINDLLFGEGLEVYPRAYENKFSVYEDGEVTCHYYELEDAELGRLIAYRYTETMFFVSGDEAREDSVYTDESGKHYFRVAYDKEYDANDVGVTEVSSYKNVNTGEVYHFYSDADGNSFYRIEYGCEVTEEEKENDKEKISSYEDTQSGKTYRFYVVEDEALGKIYKYIYRQSSLKYLQYSESERAGEKAVYTDDTGYYYSVEYEESESEFYYDADDPKGYSYVRFDAKYKSVEEIKSAAEAVYSKQYLEGIYQALFDGAAVGSSQGSGMLRARYYSYDDGEGQVWLMEADDYESRISGKRIYDFSTAKVVKPGSREFANIEIESYLEGKPEERTTVRLSLIKQEDGNWYLDSPTY